MSSCYSKFEYYWKTQLTFCSFCVSLLLHGVDWLSYNMHHRKYINSDAWPSKHHHSVALITNCVQTLACIQMNFESFVEQLHLKVKRLTCELRESQWTSLIVHNRCLWKWCLNTILFNVFYLSKCRRLCYILNIKRDMILVFWLPPYKFNRVQSHWKETRQRVHLSCFQPIPVLLNERVVS